jgi:hypothetical protein
MSTNFYFRNVGEQDYADENHIGLSVSTLFKFRSYPERALTTFQQWLKHLQADGVEIVNEYNEVVPLATFVPLVTRTKNEALSREYPNSPILVAGAPIKGELRYRDEEGHLFETTNFS